MGVLIVVDIIWLICIGSIWTAELRKNKVWNHMHGLHVFVIIVSVAEAILKIVVIALVNSHKNKLPADQNQQGYDNSGYGMENKKPENSYMMY